MTSIRVALGQFSIQAGDPPENLRRVAELAPRAAEGGAELLVLPEMWATGYDLPNNARHVPDDSGAHLEAVRALARRHRLAIAGSLLTRRGDRFYNTATLVSAEGETLLHYDKLHLFTPFDEHHYLQPGDLAGAVTREVTWPGGAHATLALAVCYDLRFPELFRRYAGDGAGLIVLPAEWPRSRTGHWRLLLQARAVENLCFVVGVNRTGSSNGTVFGGHSLVCDPWGEIIAEAGEDDELLICEVDPARVAATRARFPALADRRPDLWPAPALAAGRSGGATG